MAHREQSATFMAETADTRGRASAQWVVRQLVNGRHGRRRGHHGHARPRDARDPVQTGAQRISTLELRLPCT